MQLHEFILVDTRLLKEVMQAEESARSKRLIMTMRKRLPVKFLFIDFFFK